MTQARFEWDERKARDNESKHGVSFHLAQYAFLDPHRVIARDKRHSKNEARYYCFGRAGGGILTVRFTYRGDTIRIIGAGYRRRGKKIYDAENQVHK